MKLLLIVGLAANFITCAAAQTPQIFSGQVSAGIVALDNKNSVYFSRGMKWHKQVLKVVDVTYDVKKTDSALTPLIGVLRATILTLRSPGFNTQEEAERAAVGPTTYYKINATFVQSDPPGAKWILKNGKAELFSATDNKLADFVITGSKDVPYDNFIAEIIR